MIDHCVLCSSQDYIGTGTRDLHHPILESAKKHRHYCLGLLFILCEG
jgi:hypothetical protein